MGADHRPVPGDARLTRASAAARVRLGLRPAGRHPQTIESILTSSGLQGVVDRTGWWGRRVTWPARVLPDFLLLGAQKAATTSLFGWLCTHPDVVAPVAKELHHFEQVPRPGPAGYRAAFPLAWRLRAPRRHGGWITGEATPEYLFDPAVPPRVVEALGEDLRFVVVLREPWARARSHHRMALRHGWDDRPLADALLADARLVEVQRAAAQRGTGSAVSARHSYLRRGLYADQLERWFLTCPREQFLVLRFEDLVADPGAHAGRLEHHLRLRPGLVPGRFRHRHQGGDGTRDVAGPPPGAEELAGFFAESNRRVRALVGIGWDTE